MFPGEDGIGCLPSKDTSYLNCMLLGGGARVDG